MRHYAPTVASIHDSSLSRLIKSDWRVRLPLGEAELCGWPALRSRLVDVGCRQSASREEPRVGCAQVADAAEPPEHPLAVLREGVTAPAAAHGRLSATSRPAGTVASPLFSMKLATRRTCPAFHQAPSRPIRMPCRWTLGPGRGRIPPASTACADRVGTWHRRCGFTIPRGVRQRDRREIFSAPSHAGGWHGLGHAFAAAAGRREGRTYPRASRTLHAALLMSCTAVHRFA